MESNRFFVGESPITIIHADVTKAAAVTASAELPTTSKKSSLITAIFLRPDITVTRVFFIITVKGDTWMGDRLRASIPSRFVTRQLG